MLGVVDTSPGTMLFPLLALPERHASLERLLHWLALGTLQRRSASLPFFCKLGHKSTAHLVIVGARVRKQMGLLCAVCVLCASQWAWLLPCWLAAASGFKFFLAFCHWLFPPFPAAFSPEMVFPYFPLSSRPLTVNHSDVWILWYLFHADAISCFTILPPQGCLKLQTQMSSAVRLLLNSYLVCHACACNNTAQGNQG